MELTHNIVLLISGKMSSGKTTSAKFFFDEAIKYNFSVLNTSFAVKLKELARTGFKWNGEKDEKGRLLLQHLGDVGREYNPNIWVDHVLYQCYNYPSDFTVIDDYRYPNEKNGFITLSPLYSVVTARIVRPGIAPSPGTEHSSENALLDVPEDYDYFINNDGNLNDLNLKIKTMFEGIVDKYIYK